MLETHFILIQQVLAIITLILGGALIIFIYDAYRVVRQPTLLYFTAGLFVLVIGIVLPDIAAITDQAGTFTYWSAVISRILAIIGIGVMNLAVLRG
jgi:CDP-diglyceride synthetase